MLDAQLLAFVGLAGLLTITPGADTMLVIRSVLARGWQSGLWTTLGVCTGLLVHATLSALGLSLILVRSAVAFNVVKWAGALYLIGLGLSSLWKLTQPIEGEDTLTASEGEATRSAPQALAEGVLNNVLNPKVAIFYLAIFPQFIEPGQDAFSRSMLLAGIHFVEGMLWLGFVSVAIGRVRAWVTSPEVRRWVEGVTGLVLLGFGVRLALERG